MTAPCRVLVVDDEDSLRITLAANLELEGFEILEAASAEHALAVLSKEKVDLVLTDIRMPGMNGVELFRQIKQQSPHTPVLLMTAFAVEELVQAALREGVFTLLPKPFDMGHAVRALQRAAKAPVVLVVDDVAHDSRSTAEALQAIGVSSDAVTSGEEALAKVRQGQVDVCVVDLVMPGMSGAELLNQLRQLDPSLAIIAMSGFSVPELMQKAANERVYTCLKKPFDPAELVQAIACARGEAAQGLS